MAGGCYQHCANCGEKSFYDANIDWESQYTGKDEWGNPVLESLCEDCAKTHDIVCVPRSELPLCDEDSRASAEAEAREEGRRAGYDAGFRDGDRKAMQHCADWLRETADEPATCHANGCDALRDAADFFERQAKLAVDLPPPTKSACAWGHE